MQGWISLHRKIKKHWIFKNAEYLKAWVTILLEVNHEDKKILIGNNLLNCNRGESLNSLNTWCDILGKYWTMQKLRTFLKLLKNDGMINIEGLNKTTRLTVENYNTYQMEQQTDNKQITNKQQTDNKQITTNNNDNNDNNIKKVTKVTKKSFTPPTKIEAYEYYKQKTNDIITELREKIPNFTISKEKAEMEFLKFWEYYNPDWKRKQGNKLVKVSCWKSVVSRWVTNGLKNIKDYTNDRR